MTHIVACGGGGWSSDSAVGPLERYILGLAPSRPRVCLIPTASGDSDWLVARFYEAFAATDCRLSHLPLFRPHPAPLAASLDAVDVIYVGGGSTANLMAVWGVHGLGPLLRRAAGRGAVLAGVSAGAICWFTTGLTNSLGAGYAPVEGLALVPGGFCPHIDSDAGRLGALRAQIAAGRMPTTLAVDDGAGVHIDGEGAVTAIAVDATRRVRRVGPDGDEELSVRTSL